MSEAKDVKHMASLARLQISQEEEAQFAEQFDEILNWMSILSQVNTDGVEPLYSPVLHATHLREDTAFNKREKKAVLQNAPQTDGDYFIVPRIV